MELLLDFVRLLSTIAGLLVVLKLFRWRISQLRTSDILDIVQIVFNHSLARLVDYNDHYKNKLCCHLVTKDSHKPTTFLTSRSSDGHLL